jgi:hypothetical protein
VNATMALLRPLWGYHAVDNTVSLWRDKLMVPLLPINLPLPMPGHLFGGKHLCLTLNTGLTVLLGPNGSGKTHVLRAMHGVVQQLINERTDLPTKTRYLASGRSSPFEHFRARVGAPHHQNTQAATVGQFNQVKDRHGYESIVGDFLALKARPDLQIKVEARLYALFSRRLRFEWEQQGLRVNFVTTRGSEYAANTEASGVLHLIGLLAALYDNDVSALFIDEPEISLHPQLQAFLLDEARRVSGDPISNAGKKLVVMATHAQSMLPLRRIYDLPNLVFFVDEAVAPMQLSSDADELKGRALAALVARISESHRMAFFARTVLLIEGPSDEIILSALTARFDHTFSGVGAQLVPVIGKGEIPSTAQLFRLMGKTVAVLADLDALADDNKLALTFTNEEAARLAATQAGHACLVAMDRAVRSAFCQAVDNWWSEVAPLAANHRYLSDRENDGTLTNTAKRRTALVVLLCTEQERLVTLPNGAAWIDLRNRLNGVLRALEAGGCFVIRRGTIEDCYVSQAATEIADKPAAAVSEAANFPDYDEIDLRQSYADALRAIDYAAPSSPINEGDFLRGQLAGLLGTIFQSLRADTPDDDIAVGATASNPDASKIFSLRNASAERGGRPALEISIKSPLFARPSFPAVITRDQNLTAEVENLLRE